MSPSPTVTMLRLMRASLYSFLFSLSMATVALSSGSGFSTFPPHSTCRGKYLQNKLLWTRLQGFGHCAGWKAYVVHSNDAPSPQQLQRLLIVVVIVLLVCVNEDEVKGSSLTSSQKVVWKDKVCALYEALRVFETFKSHVTPKTDALDDVLRHCVIEQRLPIKLITRQNDSKTN